MKRSCVWLCKDELYVSNVYVVYDSNVCVVFFTFDGLVSTEYNSQWPIEIRKAGFVTTIV